MAEDDTTEVESLISHAKIPTAKVSRGTARYIVVCQTNDGRKWAVARRFSEFATLRDTLATQYFLKVAAIPFPAKTWFGGNDEETVSSRRQRLELWTNDILGLYKGHREIFMFLCEDGSVRMDELTLPDSNPRSFRAPAPCARPLRQDRQPEGPIGGPAHRCAPRALVLAREISIPFADVLMAQQREQLRVAQAR